MTDAATDKKRKLDELAAKRRVDTTEPKAEAKKPQKSPTAVDNKALAKKEAELEKKEKELSKKQNLDEYDAEDGFLVAEDEDDEQDASDLDSEEEDSEEERPKKKVKKAEKKAPKDTKKPKKQIKKTKKKGSDDESDFNGSDADDGEAFVDDLAFLDKSNIIPTGRRTRGKQIDFKSILAVEGHGNDDDSDD